MDQGVYAQKREDLLMRYMAAWLLGVPGVVIVVWFLVAHLH